MPNGMGKRVVLVHTNRPVEVWARPVGPMHWGFVPEAAKIQSSSPINARAESLSTSPMFRDAFRRHRRLVVA